MVGFALTFGAWFLFMFAIAACVPPSQEIRAAINQWSKDNKYSVAEVKDMHWTDRYRYGISTTQIARRVAVEDRDGFAKSFLFIYGSPTVGKFRSQVKVIDL